MKHLEKLTRTQRNILSKLGYEDLDEVRYSSEKGNVVVFVRENGETIEVDKQVYYKMK